MFGVPVRLHFTFVLLVILLIAIGLEGPSGAEAAIYVLALLICVLLHELGHSLVSRRYGIKTVEIVMFPIGGVARLERNPKPREELWIAIAGPAVNLVIAAILIGIAAALTGTIQWETVFSKKSGDLLGQIAGGNVKTDVVWLAMLALPGTLIGCRLGMRAYSALSDRNFYDLVLALLFLSGLGLVWSSIAPR